MLNKLLNEMDGLKEEADILFILTTNRPEALERALSSRPGRVDQAIEFPLPDDEGREKLVRLYSRGVEVSDDLVKAIVRRTDKVSAAFIKELMRRSVQFSLERDGDGCIQPDDVENALDEMLFSGGSLNLKLLGAEAAEPAERPNGTAAYARDKPHSPTIEFQGADPPQKRMLVAIPDAGWCDGPSRMPSVCPSGSKGTGVPPLRVSVGVRREDLALVREPSDQTVWRLVLSLRNRTEPSAITTLAPPGWGYSGSTCRDSRSRCPIRYRRCNWGSSGWEPGRRCRC